MESRLQEFARRQEAVSRTKWIPEVNKSRIRKAWSFRPRYYRDRAASYCAVDDKIQNKHEPQGEGGEEAGTSSDTNFKRPVGGVPPTADAKSYTSLLASYGPESGTPTWKAEG